MKKLLLACVLIVALAGPAGAEKLTLMLDWFPNVDHVPVYVAQQKGFFKAAGLDVDILSPSETTDGLKLAAAGQVDLAVSYQPQATVAAAQGLPLQVVGRLVEHPLTTLLYLKKSGIDAPTDLAGRKIGYTVPGMMDVLLAAFAKINGIQGYEPVNVGFAIVQALATRQVDAIMGPLQKPTKRWNWPSAGLAAGYFELEKFGIPDYDELIFVCGRKTREKRSAALGAFVAAVARGIDAVRQNPDEALDLYFNAVPEADRQMEKKAFALTRPYFAGSQELDTVRWQRFCRFRAPARAYPAAAGG